MSAKNTLHTYGYVAKILHWLIGLLIIVMLFMGYFLEDVPLAWKKLVYGTHKSIGIIILLLMLLRLVWRLCNDQPRCPSSYPAIMRFLAHASHYALYVVAIAMPLSGWIMATAAGKMPHFLGWFYFPLPYVPQNSWLVGIAFQSHNILAVVLISLLVLHISAALFHHFILNDTVLIRMFPLPLKRKK